MTLTLVLLFSILTAVWAAFYSARRLVAPIRDLAEGTAAVAAGDYTTSLPVASNDEVGFLVRSFNDMTRRIALARREVETQHQYLDSVLRQLTSGVITLDSASAITTINTAALQLLDLGEGDARGTPFIDLCAAHEHLAPLRQALALAFDERRVHWQEQVTLLGADGRRELMCRGSTLALASETAPGHVIVIEDITAIIQGQRDAAWSEVARRLAHEIKNPLTPIQLAAERLRLKYLPKFAPGEGDLLERLTHTIIQQVDTMKAMVNTFSDYAKAPTTTRAPIDVNRLVGAVIELFHAARPDAVIECRFDARLPTLTGDAPRLRQVINNLVKNALEASPEGTNAHIIVSTLTARHALTEQIEIRIEDHGDGIPEELVANIFDPYVTSKPRGTGLGLAIVRKIVEEHNGIVTLRNRPEGGAVAVIRLPIDKEHAADEMARAEDTA